MKITDACVYLLEDREKNIEPMLSQMDALGIDGAVIHPCDSFFACENEKGNDMILAFSRKYKTRFIPTVTVNPWRKDASVVIVRYLEQGAKIVTFLPGVQGFNVCDELFNVIVEPLSEGINIMCKFLYGVINYD